MTLSDGAGTIRHSLRAMAMRLLLRGCHRRSRTHPTASFLPWASVLNPHRDRDAIRVGAHTTVRGELFVFGHGGEIEVGEWCYVGAGPGYGRPRVSASGIAC